jgi:Nif-specific regulatory protein
MISHVADPDYAIQGTLRLLSQVLGLNRGRVLLPDSANGILRIRYAYGLTPAERARGVYAHGEGTTGRVLKTGCAAVVQDIDDDPHYLARAVDRATLPQEIVAYVAVPLLRGNATIGVLAVHRLRMRPRPFSGDLRTLKIIATFIVQILHINSLILERTAQLTSENKYLKEELDSQGRSFGILGDSPALRNALRQVRRAADTRVSVLLTGESGTGKEKFARMLHLSSTRRDAPFIAINCAAIPADLIESELFGHEKGSFTGAAQTKRGKIELASGGTLFLDEIGDLDFDLQGKLLRVLEQQCIQRVGGTRDIAVDVRILAATHKDLQQLVNQGRFRIDLFYRLNVMPISLPALRERAGDVRLLARHFLNDANYEYGRSVMFGIGAIERLDTYEWPGNIRQLENVVKRAVIMANDDAITAADLDTILRHESRVTMTGTTAAADTIVRKTALRPYAWVRMDDAEAIVVALNKAGGNKTRAALALGMTLRQLSYRLQKLDIKT